MRKREANIHEEERSIYALINLKEKDEEKGRREERKERREKGKKRTEMKGRKRKRKFSIEMHHREKENTNVTREKKLNYL